MAQSYSNLEIILVDDGSPDDCGRLCDEFLKMDSRIRVVHKQNGGLSSARNVGIDIAKGEYIGFVDSDDTIEPYMYEKLYNAIYNDKTKLAVCAVNYVYENGEVLRKKSVGKDMTLDFYNAMIEMNNIMFRIFDKAQTISYVDTVCYNYLQRSNRITCSEKNNHDHEYAVNESEGVESYISYNVDTLKEKLIFMSEKSTDILTQMGEVI